eukprot:5887053-Alexandrium_andersonii.AAC.1
MQRGGPRRLRAPGTARGRVRQKRTGRGAGARQRDGAQRGGPRCLWAPGTCLLYTSPSPRD